MKKIILMALMIFTLTGCMNHEKKESYTLDEIYKTGDYGFFVKDGDAFYPVRNINEDGNEGFQWCKGKLNCPKVTTSTPLVAVYETNEDMPESYFIESYTSLGYTIGANVEIGEDGNSMWLDVSNTCRDSDVEMSFAAENVDSKIEIQSINGKLPISNVDTDVNILIGLQENKYYDISVYMGTQNKKASICADTLALKRTGRTDLNNSIKKTQEQYFLVNLPSNISPGYYDINQEGIFEI